MLGVFAMLLLLWAGVPALPFALLMAAASNVVMTVTHYATGTSPVIFGPHFGLQPR